MQIICPQCTVKLTIGEDRAGQTLNCPRCDREITIAIPQPHTGSNRPTDAQQDADQDNEGPATTSQKSQSHREASRSSEDDSDAEIELYRLRRRRAARQRVKAMRLWLALLIGLSATVVLVRYLVVRGGTRPTISRPETPSGNLAELITALHQKPEVLSIITGSDEAMQFQARTMLPPDHKYETIVALVTVRNRPKDPYCLMLVDCGSDDRARLFAERFITSSKQHDSDLLKHVAVKRTGYFVVVADDASLRWLGQYYQLR